MADPSQKTSSKSKMPEKISLRRGQKIIRNYSTRLIFQAIKNGKLLATDEYSLDGKNWVRLGNHKQLERYLKKTPPSVDHNLKESVKSPEVLNKQITEENSEKPGSPPPDLDDNLQKIADLLKIINTGS